MSSLLVRAADMSGRIRGAIVIGIAAASLAGCATATGLRHGRAAEQAQDYDRAVVEYTNVVRANPANRDARTSLERAARNIEKAETRSRVMSSKLKSVEALPADAAQRLLADGAGMGAGTDAESGTADTDQFAVLPPVE